MSLFPAVPRIAIVAAAFAITLTVISPASAQVMEPTGGSNKMQNLQASQDQLGILQNVETRSQIDPKQTDAYQKFFKVDPRNPDKKIKLGTAFLQRYPKSPYVEAVEVGLTNAYLQKQDFNDFFSTANRALALNPNEVDVLTSYGWVIPHVYNPNAPNAATQLNQAESYEKRAISLLNKMKNSPGVSDAIFEESKAQKLNQAHSALGLIYFRRADYADSATELQQSTQEASPDSTDLFVLGVDLQNLNRHADAAAAYARCGQIAGPLQAQCQKSANEQKHAAGGQ